MEITAAINRLNEHMKELNEHTKQNNALLKKVERILKKPEWVPIKEASEKLGLSVFILSRMCDSGEIPCTLTPGSKHRKRWLVDLHGAEDALRLRDLRNFKPKR